MNKKAVIWIILALVVLALLFFAFKRGGDSGADSEEGVGDETEIGTGEEADQTESLINENFLDERDSVNLGDVI